MPRYLELLRAGGSMSPSELGRLVDCDLDDPGFWDGGLAVIDGQLGAAERQGGWPPRREEVPVRVLTWNVWGRFGPWQQRQAAIAAVLAAAEADVVCLQEALQRRARAARSRNVSPRRSGCSPPRASGRSSTAARSPTACSAAGRSCMPTRCRCRTGKVVQSAQCTGGDDRRAIRTDDGRVDAPAIAWTVRPSARHRPARWPSRLALRRSDPEIAR